MGNCAENTLDCKKSHSNFCASRQVSEETNSQRSLKRCALGGNQSRDEEIGADALKDGDGAKVSDVDIVDGDKMTRVAVQDVLHPEDDDDNSNNDDNSNEAPEQSLEYSPAASCQKLLKDHVAVPKQSHFLNLIT